MLFICSFAFPGLATPGPAELPDGMKVLIVVTGKNEPGGIGFGDKEKSEIECTLKELAVIPIYKSLYTRLTIPLICIVNTKSLESSSIRARVTNVGYLYMPPAATANVAALATSLIYELENLNNSKVYETLNDRVKNGDSISKEEFVHGYFSTMALATMQVLKFQDSFPQYDDKRYKVGQFKSLYRDFKAGRLFDPNDATRKITEEQFVQLILTPLLKVSNATKKAFYEATYENYKKNALKSNKTE